MEDKTADALRIAALISRHFNGSISEADAAELQSWVNASAANNALFAELSDEKGRETQLKQLQRYDSNAAFLRVSKRLTPRQVEIALYKRRLGQFARYAAIFLLVSGLGIALFQLRRPSAKRIAALSRSYKNDINPAVHKAELILADGTSVALTKEQNKVIAAGSVGIQTHNGVLSYTVKTHSAAANYNTLITPAGKTFEMTLEDGTRVWLNAGSSLKYPTYFEGKERKVLLSGEAYFSVTHRRDRKFVVEVSGRQIEDLGTEFDVNNYSDNHFPTVTLVKGSIQVTDRTRSTILVPGQMADMAASGIEVSNADLLSITAWKNGLFVFHNEQVRDMMKIIGRWYNAHIEYAQDYLPDNTFTGEIPNNVPVSKLLDKIALTGVAEFTVSGNTITVHPYKPSNH